MLIRHMCKRGLRTSSHFLLSSLLLLSSPRKGLCHHTFWQNWINYGKYPSHTIHLNLCLYFSLMWI